MKNSIIVEDAFRQWVRTILTNELGKNPDKLSSLNFPVKRLMVIAIQEIYFYLVRNNMPAPQKNAALILDIDRISVSRA